MSDIQNLHIKELTIDNYKSLKHSKIELKPGLNIIIGKNGAGKSNLLEFIYQFASRPVTSFTPNRFHKRNLFSNYLVSLEYSLINDYHELLYSVERTKSNPTLIDNEFRFDFLFTKKINRKIIFENKSVIGDGKERWHLFFDEDLKIEIPNTIFKNIVSIKYEMPLDLSWVLKPSNFTINKYKEIIISENYSFYFFHLLQFSLETDFVLEFDISTSEADITQFKELLLKFINNYFSTHNLNEVLKLYSPISEIRINQNINIFKKEDTLIIENLFIEFLIGNDWLPWSYLSDGTKRLFYIISECIISEKGIILVEEPELGIHPHQLFKLMDFLKERSLTNQVIISTHSPMVLDILKEDELDRITVAEYDKGTKFLKLDEAQITKAKRYLNEVGELSYYWIHSDLEK